MIFAILPYSSSSAQQKGFFFLCAKRQMGGGGHDDVIHRGGTKRGRDRRGRTSGKYCSVRKYLEQHLRVSYLKVPFGMGGDSATRLRGRAKSAQALSLSLRQTAPRGQVEKHAPQRNSTTHARPRPSQPFFGTCGRHLSYECYTPFRSVPFLSSIISQVPQFSPPPPPPPYLPKWTPPWSSWRPFPPPPPPPTASPPEVGAWEEGRRRLGRRPPASASAPPPPWQWRQRSPRHPLPSSPRRPTSCACRVARLRLGLGPGLRPRLRLRSRGGGGGRRSPYGSRPPHREFVPSRPPRNGWGRRWGGRHCRPPPLRRRHRHRRHRHRRHRRRRRRRRPRGRRRREGFGTRSGRWTA